jgi:hypothetical protein
MHSSNHTWILSQQDISHCSPNIHNLFLKQKKHSSTFEGLSGALITPLPHTSLSNQFENGERKKKLNVAIKEKKRVKVNEKKGKLKKEDRKKARIQKR